MFMFRSRKTNLIRRLLKAGRRRHCGCDESGRASEEDDHHQHHHHLLESAVSASLKSLQENQLEILLRAVETDGHDPSNCVLMPARPPQDLEMEEEEQHVLFCRMWRWPDLRDDDELRRLPMCPCDPVYVCCNPYHFSRLYQPETPPPPYSRTNADRMRPEDRAPSEVPLLYRDSYPESLTTNGDSYLTHQGWCRLAYWEMSVRVGSLYPVEAPAVNVFWDVPHPNGLSIKTLAQHRYRPPDSVTKNRCKIGLGVTLSREEDCVWVYNRSEHPIFVSSVTLEDPASPSPTRVPAEHCLCVFDAEAASRRPQYRGGVGRRHFGPRDPNSITISFVKGWGQNYSRPEITSCPCWLEVLLAPCR